MREFSITCVIVALIIAVLNVLFDSGVRSWDPVGAHYGDVLRCFDQRTPWAGYEPEWGTRYDEPMTAALVLMAEGNRDDAIPDYTAPERHMRCLQYLLQHSDEDGNGIVGWGLPQAFDAFQDASTNPPNTAYTITTALVLQAFVECHEKASPTEQRHIEQLIAVALRHWHREIFHKDFFGYST